MKTPLSTSLTRAIIAAFILFLLAAILGLIMRLAFVVDMLDWFDYRNVQYAHSHTALLGWLFAIFYILIVRTFELKWQKYSRLYWSLQASVLGMLLAFPVVGHTSLAILFSSLHTVLLYVFIYKVWQDVNISSHGHVPALFLRASLFFLGLSTIGTWAIGPLMTAGMKGTALYYGSIQFYLHFQFNGWFIFSLLAIFFEWLRTKNLCTTIKYGTSFLWTSVIATVLTFALAVTWSTPHFSIFMINSLGVLNQLIALFLFIKLMLHLKIQLRSSISKYIYYVLLLSFVALILKILLQSVVIFPAMALVSYTIRNLVIGFIHLLMLGGLSLFTFGMIADAVERPLNKIGTYLFISGVIVTELLLFGQGLMQWQGWGFMPFYYEMLVVGSSLIVTGIIFILFHFYRNYSTAKSFKNE